MKTLLVFALVALGCSGSNFDLASQGEDDANVPPSDSGSAPDDARPLGELRPDVDAADAGGLLDSPNDTPETFPDTAVIDAGPALFDHQTPAGDKYRSTLPPGAYSPALYGETFAQVKVAHPGDWKGPYEATCDLSSEGFSNTEKCLFTETATMGVMACPHGIGYASSSPSCPPAATKVSWW